MTGREPPIGHGRRRTARLLLAAGTAAGGLAAAIVVLHTRYGRPVMERVAGHLRTVPCPGAQI